MAQVHNSTLKKLYNTTE